ncbi:MAG: DUF3352 domain-containing protein [Actinobacteria bacterium]|nr:DUF3352 domain-containing protein [Actinomycetota bacterium]
MRTKLIALFAVAVVLAGTGIYALASLNKDSTDRAIELVPADAVLYTHVFVKPSVNQRKALRGLLAHFPHAPEADEALDPLFGLIDQGLEQYDMTYEEDIKPWLGDQMAIFLTGPQSGAVLIGTEDAEATEDFIAAINEVEGIKIEPKTYEGVEYQFMQGGAYAFIDDFMVSAPEEDLRSVIDVHAGGRSLADVDRYTDIEQELVADRIFTMYLDTEGLVEMIGSAGVPGFAGPTDEMSDVGSAMLAGYLRDDAVVFELAGPTGELPIPTGPFDLSDGVPSDAWFALGSPGVGKTLESSLESFAGASGASLEALLGEFTAQTGFDLRTDFLSWMEDLRIYVRGTGLLNFGGAVSIGSSDPAASREAVDQLMALALQEGFPSQPVEIAGIESYAISIPGSPQPIVVVPGDRVVISYGEAAAEDALDPDEPLSTSEGFASALEKLGDGMDAYFFLDIDAVQGLVENFLPPVDLYVNEVKPWLDPIAHVIAGSKFSDDSYLVRFVIGVE